MQEQWNTRFVPVLSYHNVIIKEIITLIKHQTDFLFQHDNTANQRITSDFLNNLIGL